MAITLLSSPPPALSPEELAALSASTPSTFEGIAPLLRHREDNVDLTVDPPFQGYAGGKGTLYVTEGALSFYSESTSSGVSLPYPHITMHAISRAPLRSVSEGAEQLGGGPCIYCQVDENDETVESDDMDSSKEVIIIPSDPSSLDKIFDLLSHCAALHPPPAGSAEGGLFGGLDPDSAVYADANADAEEDNGIEQMTEEEEANELSSAGRAARDYLESIITFSSSTPTPSAPPRMNGHTDPTANGSLDQSASAPPQLDGN